MSCPKDDKADCCGKCGQPKVVAVIPVLGRGPLLTQTVRRLIHKNKVDVICVGDQNEDRKIAEAAGAKWVQFRNRPLGAKWNAGFLEAGRLGAEAVLFVGSSDWVSDNWIHELSGDLKKYDLIGTAGCHFLHISDEMHLCYWPGYNSQRRGESIGIGRLISSKVLSDLQWKPFNDQLDKSLDGSMQQSVMKVAGKVHITSNKKIISVSISTDNWLNKHNFWDHWGGKLPSTKILNPDIWIDRNFPEARIVFHKTLTP